MRTILLIFFTFLYAFMYSQKIHNATLTSAFFHTSTGNTKLSSSVGEAAPVTELSIGANKITQGFFQYDLKKTTKIINDKNQVQLSVFPNPFIDELKVDLMESGYGKIEFRLENILGQIVYTTTINRTIGHNDYIPLKLIDISNGTYLLNILFLDDKNHKKYTIKLIKN